MRFLHKAGGSLMLLATAMIWGAAFVTQRSGMTYLGPATFQSVRILLGFFSLLPVALLRRKRLGAAYRRPSLVAVLTCGVLLGTASVVLQHGLISTPAGKAGFISALYVVVVPLLGLLGGRRVGLRGWLGIGLAVIGLYLLTAVGSLRMEQGEVTVLVSMLLFSLHIIAIDRFSPQADGVMLSCLQFLVAGLLLLPFSLIYEHPTGSALWQARWLLLYTGVLSCAVAYTLQILGQQRTPPALATLILCLESVFSVISGAVFLHERMSGRELAGCALMLSAVMIAQLPGKVKRDISETAA